MKLSLPKEATDILHFCGNDGYADLQKNTYLSTQNLLWYLLDVFHTTPQKGINDFVHLYFRQVQWYRRMLTYILDYVTDPDKEYI